MFSVLSRSFCNIIVGIFVKLFVLLVAKIHDLVVYSVVMKTILCFRNFTSRGSHFEHGHPSYHHEAG